MHCSIFSLRILATVIAIVPPTIAAGESVDRANIISTKSSTGLPWANHRYAYKAAYEMKIGNTQGPDQIVPVTQYVDKGKSVSVRVSHTHPKPVPEREVMPRDVAVEAVKTTTSSHTQHSPGPVIHNPGDLADILFTDKREVHVESAGTNVHVELETRTVPYSTDESGIAYYRASEFSVSHTHPEKGPLPMVPNINPTMKVGDQQKRPVGGYKLNTVVLNTIKTTSTSIFNPHPSATPGHTHLEARSIQTSIPDEQLQALRDRIEMLRQLAKLPRPLAVNISHGDSKYSHNHSHVSINHDDGDGDIAVFNSSISMPPRDLSPVTSSVIYDGFWGDSITVTYVGGSTWEMIPWADMATSEIPTPTGNIIGPAATIFDPVMNVTYDVVPYDDPADPAIPVSFFWDPVSTGEPTLPEHIAIASSYRAAGGQYPVMPTPHLVFDPKTNITWNNTFKGDAVNWIPVYFPVSTGYPPAFTNSAVPWIPTWPAKRDVSSTNTLDPEFHDFTSLHPPKTGTIGPEEHATEPLPSVTKYVGPARTPGQAKIAVGDSGIVALPHAHPDSLFPGLNSPRPKPESRNVNQDKIDKHYPVPFFRDGPENYQVWSEWFDPCRVIKHITKKGDHHVEVKPFGEIGELSGEGRVHSTCNNNIDYLIHLENTSEAYKVYKDALVVNRDFTQDGYAPQIPTWPRLTRDPTETTEKVQPGDTDFLRPDWIANCTVVLHHAADNSFGIMFHKSYDFNGQLITPSTACRTLNILLHVEEFHSTEGFQIGDWWVTPQDDEPVYRTSS
ncbi:hypothetical protein ABW20_dc0102440 [Dactylellina cionopaga]|nr:hypothetical protein ABW20_dc0102440 [Dactylellina cionopaga]